MAGIFGLLYLILILVYIIIFLFIIYHILRFSFQKSVMVLALGIFVSVFCCLLFSNLMLFLTIKWDKVFSLF